MAKLFYFILCTLYLVGFGRGQQESPSSRRRAEQDYLQRALSSYNKDLNPGGDDTGGRTNVTVNFYVRDILKIDEASQEMVLQLTLRQQWRDGRLKYSDKPLGKDNTSYVTVTDVNRVWRPDLFIANDIESRRHDFAATNAFVRIFPNGDVLSSERLSAKIRCPMQLSRFPFDVQTCSIRLASYGYTERDLVFRWKDEDPVQVNSRLNLPRFILTDFATDYCDSPTQTGVYSCIRADFTLARQVRWYLLQVFIPCSMFVLVGAVAFWIAPEKVTARILLNALTLFALALQVARLNERLPEVSYTKAIDIWTGICLTFTFIALLQSATVHYVRRHYERAELAQVSSQSEDGTSPDDPEAEALKPESEAVSGEARRDGVKFLRKLLLPKSNRKISSTLDCIFRILYPGLFLFFVIVYFLAYSSS